MAAALLAAVALYLAWNAWTSRNWLGRIADLLERYSPARIYVGWAMAVWLGFALPAFLGMILLRRDPFAMPPEFVTEWLTPFPWIGWVFAATMAVGMALNLGIALRRRRLGKAPARVLAFPLPKPMRLGETRAPASLALSVGVSEELFFRQFLALLVVLVSGSLVAGVLVQAAANALVYRYRGGRWMVVMALIGLALSYLYLVSGSLLLVMAFRVVVAFNRLVIDPIAFWPRAGSSQG
jgi:hypothetical protein